MQELTEQDLRDRSGEIVVALERGESFILTRDGVPVGELRPIERRTFVSTALLQALFRGAPRIDAQRFREDIDRYVDQDSTPRG